jgi:hypothetical protein
MDPELNPADCPEGISPDNQDMQYKPGSTDSRDGLHKLLAAPLPGTPTIVYQKTYLQLTGQALTLILDSNGAFWVENVSTGVVTQFGSVPAGLFAQSVTAFGREYIAVSDLLHGQGVPLQYDGTNLDRVSQDGPGAAPVASDETTSLNIQAAGFPGLQMGPATVAIASISESGYLVTVVVTGAFPPGFNQVGDPITIAGANAFYNGTWTIAAVLPDNKTIQFVRANSTGIPPANSGTVTTYRIVVNTTTTPAVFSAGQSAAIAGAGIAGYDGTYVIRSVNLPFSQVEVVPTVAQVNAALGNSGGGTISAVGQVAVGVHQLVVMFLTRQGYLTKPSPVASWLASGNLRAQVSSLPIGGANVVARVLAFTGAGGGNFFTLLATPQVAGAVVGTALIVPDNTTTTAVFDFADTTLFAGVAIDQVGNDLFDQVVLGPVAGFFVYASRLFPWGEWNKVQNFLNMGFEGGYFANAPTIPLGWNAGGSTGGALIAGGAWASGLAWQITGDGSANQLGTLSQQAYQDELGDAILEPNIQYTFRLWAKATAGSTGTLTIQLTSASTGFTATATINLATLTTQGSFVNAVFSIATPAVIPVDVELSLYETNLGLGKILVLDELELIFTQKPYLDNEMRASYVINPEAFAETTGVIGPEDDVAPIRCLSLQRASVLLKTAEGTHTFQANDFEPDQWSVNALSRSVGACSLRAGDPGLFGTGDASEDWDLSLNQNGLYLFAGGDFWKVSQEMQPVIDSINWAAEAPIWVRNDVKTRRAYLGVPINGATAPNIVLVMDYRELDTATQIASAPPVHISLTGKMICSDLTRKWSRWNIKANTAEVLIRQGNLKQMTFGGGNGQTPGAAAGFGNLYYLDPAKLTDDDYGQIFPYYVTYGFVNHEQEQALGIGSHRKLVKKVCAFATGTGYLYFTPLVDSLQNALPWSSSRQLTANTNPGNALGQDLEWTQTIRGERVFFKWQVAPLGGTTDVKLSLQKMIVTMMQDPMAVMRSSRL